MNLTVLLIDDYEASNYLHRIVLEDCGYKMNIKAVFSAQEGLNFIHNTDIFQVLNASKTLLIFLDINMPGMNGWNFLEAYKKLEEEIKSRTVIVMLSTSLNPDDKLRSEQIDEVDEYYSKPLTEKKVQELMAKHFQSFLLNQ